MKPRLLLIFLMAAMLLAGCGSKDERITSLKMLEGSKTFAVPLGTVADQFVRKRYPDARLEYYNSVLDCAIAVQDGKADAVVYDLPILKNIAAANDHMVVLPELLFDDQYGFAVQKENQVLKEAMDSTLAELKRSGIYEEMNQRWFPETGPPGPMPAINFSGEQGVLKFGTAAITEPMAYIDSSKQIVGYDIEFASRIALRLGKKLEIVDMEFGALLPALMSGKVDMVGAGMSITEERSKKVLFSECYYPSGIAALVRGEKPSASSAGGKMSSLSDISNKRIGVLLGSVHDAYATKTFPSAVILQYPNPSDMLFGLNSGKVDVAFYDHAGLKDVFNKNKDLGLLAKDVFTVGIGAGFNEAGDALREQFNKFLKEIKENGTYNDMVNRWMEQGNTVMPEIKSSGTNGELRAGIVSDIGLPFTIIQDGKLAGFDIELSTRFAAYTDKKFVPVDMQFGSLIASISTNKIDIITSSMMITEEREKQIDFSDPYYESGVSVIARKEDIAQKPAARLASTDDLKDKKIGILTGTVHDALISKKYPAATLLRFDRSPDMVATLKSGKVDAFLMALPTAKVILKSNPNLAILSDRILQMPLGFGFHKDNPALKDQFNAFLKEIRASGIYDSAYRRWFVEDPEKAVMPEFRNPPGGKILSVGISVNDLPYIADMNGRFVGFDIELIERFAEREKYQLKFTVMEFSSLVASLAAGKVDMIADGIAISEERQKMINFSDSYVDLQTAVVVQKKDMEPSGVPVDPTEGPSFTEKLKESFHNNIILEKRYLHIIDGLVVTIIISIFSALLGTLIGAGICMMRMSKKRMLSQPARFYISLLRGTPVLVLLMIIYYVVFASVNINPVIVAIFAFGMNFGAYVSEMFRTSIESLDKGQKEAAIAGGFTKFQTFRYIILPQALVSILPVYKGEFISMIKMTSIVGYIAVQDLTKASDIIRSRTFDAFFPLIMVAVIYLGLAWLLSWALGLIEISVDPKRKRVQKMEGKAL